MTESWEKTTWRLARRPHTCCECRSQINPGTRYACNAGSWDGEFFSEKMCALCHELRDSYFCAMRANWTYEPDEVVYSRGSLIEEVEVYLERRRTAPTLAEARAPLVSMLVADAESSLRQARDVRVRAREYRARRVYNGEQAYYSRLVARGMSAAGRGLI